jgi:3-oxoacyl-[acyl-carrier-protein] synthase-3
MKKAAIKGIRYHLPEYILHNRELSQDYPDWTPEKISAKTGIEERRIAAEGECASDLAEQAALRLFESGVCQPEQIEYVLLCTQSPDYFLPTTACVLQDRLGIPTSAGALDFNLGCSGYVYGLSMAKGLIETGQVNNVLLITAETYSKYISKEDMNVRALFGDGAAATFIEATDADEDCIGPFVFGSDGSGKNKLIVENGASRFPVSAEGSSDNLFMDGPEIFSFTMTSVPRAIKALFERSGLGMDDIDMFVFHQANEFMLNHLRKKTKIPAEKFCVDLSHTGNTVSATIPIALSNLLRDGKVKSGDTIALVGFGVGYSWAANICKIA